MAHTKRCEGCNHAHDDGDVYGRLGCTAVPSVTSKVVVAFLLPLLLFLLGLGGFGRLLRTMGVGPYQTPLALLLTIVAVAGLMCVARAVVRARRSARISNGEP